MDREFFKDYMNRLITADDFFDKIYGENINSMNPIIGNIFNGYIRLLCAVLEIPYEDNDISFYLYECDKGKSDNAWVEFDGIKYPLTTIDELYDWLVVYKGIINKTDVRYNV